MAAVRSPVFRHAGSWRHAGRAWWCPTQIAPRRWCGAVAFAMVLRATCCVSRVWLVGSCGAMTACHRLLGGIFVGGVGGPRMSPTPRSAKYGATHSGNPSRGGENVRLRSSSPQAAGGGRGCLSCGTKKEMPKHLFVLEHYEL